MRLVMAERERVGGVNRDGGRRRQAADGTACFGRHVSPGIKLISRDQSALIPNKDWWEKEFCLLWTNS